MIERLSARNAAPKGESQEQKIARLERSDSDFIESSKNLSSMILGPAPDVIAGKRILVAADGALQYVPFAALMDPAAKSGSYTPLITSHEVVSVPSASVLAEMRRETAARAAASRGLAIFADPVFDRDDPRLTKPANEPPASSALLNAGLSRAAMDTGLATEGMPLPRLIFTRREAEQIAQLATREPVLKALDYRASLKAATSKEVSASRIVHFATHGFLNAEHPDLSGLVLSLFDENGKPQNGFLKLQDVFNLELPADLVVLSACQTALGREIKGEGLMGLTRGFMYAGANRVMASLWKVDDAATAELMTRFYRGMFAGKDRSAAALRKAQLSMWKERRWSSPYYWAAFIFQGEWR